MVHFRGAAQRVAVAVAHAMALVDEVQVGVEVDDVDRAAAFEGLDNRCVHRVVTTEHDRHGTGLEQLAYGEFDVVVTGVHIGMDDIGVTHVDDAHILGLQVHHVVFEIVGTAVAKRKQGRCLTDAAWPEACAGAPLGAHVVGSPKHRDVGIDVFPVEADRRFGEGAVANEGQVQATFFIAVAGHVRRLRIVLVEYRSSCSHLVHGLTIGFTCALKNDDHTMRKSPFPM
ncbi:hypothetical protein D9M71_115320 [compost metagenome]